MQDNLTKKKKKSGEMSRQVILLKTVQEALGKEKNNQSKQNILGCSFTSLKNTTGNLSEFSD